MLGLEGSRRRASNLSLAAHPHSLCSDDWLPGMCLEPGHTKPQGSAFPCVPIVQPHRPHGP